MSPLREIIADFHIHVNSSPDSLISPKGLIKMASKKGIEVLAITDHNSLKGGKLTIEEAKNANAQILVVKGAEISSDRGHVLALFIQNEIRSRNYETVIDEIHDQDGLAVIAHPCKKSQKFTKKQFAKIDLLEGLNGRATSKENNSALKLANSLGIDVIAGSDSHLPFELGRVRTILPWKPNDIMELKEMLLTHKVVRNEINVDSFSPYLTHFLSFSVENSRRLLNCEY